MDDLDILEKSFNKLENYISKYIYIKYIQVQESNGESTEESNGESNEETTEPKPYKYNSKVLNQDEYSKFLHSIFSNERKYIITQDEYLDTDLNNMAIADENYGNSPETFKVREHASLPDVKRCSFIRKHKNKYKRCALGIINDDSDMCYKHFKNKNMYWDKWCELLEKK